MATNASTLGSRLYSPAEEKVAQRQLNRDRFESQKQGNLDQRAQQLERINRQHNESLRGKSAAERNKIDRQHNKRIAALTSGLSPEAQLALAATIAYRRIWTWAMGAVAAIAVAFTDFILISGPVFITMYLLRLMGTFQGSGGWSISFRGQPIKVFPAYDIIDGMAWAGTFILIGSLTLIVYGTAGILIYFLVYPLEVAELGLGAAAGFFLALVQFFGLGG